MSTAEPIPFPDPGEPARRGRADWMALMSDEDRAFIKRFLLNSGSLKAVAQEYGISYPTVRLRLDRLIQKIKLTEEHHHRTDFELTLRAQHADGRIDAATLKTLLAAYREDLDERTT
ncbi:MAG: DUF2089 family protein [Planctomycetota bacterium]